MTENWKFLEFFFNTLQGMRVPSDKEDKLLLKESKDGRLFVKSLYEMLDQPSTFSFPYLHFWSSYVSTKVSFFFLLEKLLTLKIIFRLK